MSTREYLERIGFIEADIVEEFGFGRWKALPADTDTEDALRQFRELYGELDESSPRCGFPDPPLSTFVHHGNQWNKTGLTYGFVETTPDLGDAAVRSLTAQAFSRWSEVCNLNFKEVHEGLPDIVIRFVRGNHGDGNPFDGEHGVLAHGFWPPPNGGHLAGDCHFDEAEDWASTYDYLSVAIHEIGHALGLAHSTVKGSIMWPYYSGQRELHGDDIAGVQALYGARVTPKPPEPEPPTPEPPEEPDMAEWPPFAIRRPGPANKSGGYAAGNSGPKRGEVKHSAVGFEHGMWSVLDDPNRPSSWHYSVMLDGRIFAHYPRSAHTWHAGDSDPDGGVRANLDLVGTEHEGGEPGNESALLTEAQVQATIRLTRWLMEQDGKDRATRYPDQTGFVLVEHREVANSPTACPSGRIPWDRILAELSPPEGPFYNREQALWALNALGFWYGAKVFPDAGIELHEFDKRIIRDIVGKL